MPKTAAQRRLDRIHLAVGREIVEQFFSNPLLLEPFLDDSDPASPALLRKALLDVISPHPRQAELRGQVLPTTAACLNLIDSEVRAAAAAGQIEGITLEWARTILTEKLDHTIAVRTIAEMIRRNFALHDLAVFNYRIRLRGDLLADLIDRRHQMKLRQRQAQQVQSWEAWS